MTDEQYGEDTINMLVMVNFFETQIECVLAGEVFHEEVWLDQLESINFGRELINRKLVKAFFGGGPQGVNQRTRQELLKLMLEVDLLYPQLKGENFDNNLKEILRKSA